MIKESILLNAETSLFSYLNWLMREYTPVYIYGVQEKHQAKELHNKIRKVFRESVQRMEVRIGEESNESFRLADIIAEEINMDIRNVLLKMNRSAFLLDFRALSRMISDKLMEIFKAIHDFIKNSSDGM